MTPDAHTFDVGPRSEAQPPSHGVDSPAPPSAPENGSQRPSSLRTMTDSALDFTTDVKTEMNQKGGVTESMVRKLVMAVELCVGAIQAHDVGHEAARDAKAAYRDGSWLS